MFLRFLGIICALLMSSCIAYADGDVRDVQELDHDQRWSLYRAKRDGKFLCYTGSFPIKQEGDYRHRDDPYVIVLVNEDGENEVNITAGYTYRDQSEVMVSIDGKTFPSLFTRDDFAWTQKPEHDNAIIKQMKAGLTMRVSATSDKLTKSYDTYSLLGFRKMYTRMMKLCVRGGV